MEAINSVGQTAQSVGGVMSDAMMGVQDAVSGLADGLVHLAVTGEGSLGDLLMSFIKTVGQIIVQMLLLKAIEMATGIPVSSFMRGGSGGGGGGGNFLSNLMGFKNGGSFGVGGSGTVDSKLVAFRATPGERVDISTRGQQRQQGGGGNSYSFSGNMMTPEFWRQIQSEVAAGEGRSNAWAAQNVPALAQNQASRQQMYSTGRKRR